jgi:hypothetical protein
MLSQVDIGSLAADQYSAWRAIRCRWGVTLSVRSRRRCGKRHHTSAPIVTVIPGETHVPERALGDLEVVVMERVWQHRTNVSVREIFGELSQARPIAYTTVMSTMDNLYRNQWLGRERVGKAYLYWPTMTREETLRAIDGCCAGFRWR